MNMCLSDEHAHALSSEILFPMHNKRLRTGCFVKLSPLAWSSNRIQFLAEFNGGQFGLVCMLYVARCSFINLNPRPQSPS